MKIVTLTLNPALDKSSSIDRLIPEQKLRCAPMRLDAGGGGINVSKGIRKLGGESTAVFPSGGATGLRLQALLQEAGVDIAAHPVPGEMRENFSVTETSTNFQYRFTMPGLNISEQQVANYRFAAIKKLSENMRDAGLPSEVFPELKEES